MICNLGDPTSLRHLVPKILGRRYGQYSKLTYVNSHSTTLHHPAPPCPTQHHKTPHSTTPNSKLTYVNAIFERAVDGAEILVFMVHILGRVQEITRPGVCLGRPSWSWHWCYSCVAVCCGVLRCVAVCCSVLQCVAVCCSVLRWAQESVSEGPLDHGTVLFLCCSVLQCVTVCCSVLQCVAVCCSVLQCVAVCCSVLQWSPTHGLKSPLDCGTGTIPGDRWVMSQYVCVMSQYVWVMSHYVWVMSQYVWVMSRYRWVMSPYG